MNMREAILAALRRDPELVPKIAEALKEKIGDQGRAATVVQAAGALEPVLEDAVRKRPSRLGSLGLKSAHILAGLALEDDRSNRLLEHIGRGSSIGITFVDLADFVAFTEKHGDDEAIFVVNTLAEIVESAIRPCKGQLVKRLGDGFLVAFPSASQAIRGAVTIRDRAMKRRSNGPNFPLMVRIAVHAGEPLIEQDDLLGHDVNLTARLLDHCAPGEVVVSSAAKDLAERRLRAVEFGPPREVKIRGLAGRVTILSADPRNATVRSPHGTGGGSRPQPSGQRSRNW